MVSCQNLFVLLFGWCYLSCGCCFMLDSYLTRLKSKTEAGRFEKTRAGDQSTKDEKYLILRETVSEHMQVLYMKYNKTGFHFKDGNTVRSFEARWGTINSMELQVFNLSSLTKSEDILSATLHFYVGNIRSTSHRCVSPNACRRHDPRKAHVQLGIWSFAPFDNNTRTLGHININVSKHNRDITKWKYNDITRIVQQAKHHNNLLVGIDVSLQGFRLLKGISYPPSYILVYANDSAVFGPESVVSTLRRHKAPLDPQVDFPRTWNSSTERRTRRSAKILLPLQNNELPGNEYPYEDPRWDENDPYQSLDNNHAKRSRQKTPKTHRHKMPLLKFDDQTIKKARKKQWIESLNCARRNLKVDFADIGWSEWIISPKSFDAYYCSGSCQFPMPKSVKPSNHATIQSIVRAVGVVPGIPEPGCVPERMSSLSILFFDQDKNVVLKVYPNMTVDSCVCR